MTLAEPGLVVSIVTLSLWLRKSKPHLAQRAACSEFSTLQEGQIIDGFGESRKKGPRARDYASTRRPPATSTLPGVATDEWPGQFKQSSF